MAIATIKIAVFVPAIAIANRGILKASFTIENTAVTTPNNAATIAIIIPKRGSGCVLSNVVALNGLRIGGSV